MYDLDGLYGLRPSAKSDVSAIAEIGQRTFRQTYFDHFKTNYGVAALDRYTKVTFSDEETDAEFLDPAASFYLVESRTNEVVGYMKLHRSARPDCLRGNPSLCIERVYLDSIVQSRGLGTHLLKFAIQSAVDKGAASIWLQCWEGHHRALSFYRKHGFLPVGQLPFKITGTEFSDTDTVLEKSVRAV